MPHCSCGKKIDAPRQSRCKDCQREYDRNYRKLHGEDMDRKNKEWREKTKYAERLHRWYLEHRLKVFQKVSGLEIPRCVYCDCDDMRLLEINHKNGGGNKIDYRHKHDGSSKTTTFYRRILSGERSIEDLEVACKPCNSRHYLELKYGPLPFTIKWK